MKKKLLLLPIVLFSSFLGACEYRTEFIPLKDIFNIDKQGHYGYYYYDHYSDHYEYRDYKNDVLNILKTYTSDAEYVKRINDSSDFQRSYNVKTISYRFNISGDYKKMNYFIINAYETGDIEVRVSGAGWPISPQDQNSLYRISEETASELFTTVTSYIEDMNAGLEQEEETVKEASKIDNFFTAYSTLENRKVTYSYSGYDSRIKRPYVREIDIPDNDGEYLELLIDLEYKRYAEDNGIFVNNEDCIKVTINEQWHMVLDYMQATGYVYYEYESKYKGLTAYEYRFTVNQSKVDALYRKMYDQVKNQIE